MNGPCPGGEAWGDWSQRMAARTPGLRPAPMYELSHYCIIAVYLSSDDSRWYPNCRAEHTRNYYRLQVDDSRSEAARKEAARVEAARIEAAQKEAARIESARVKAEAAQKEAARIESARIKAEAARVEAARIEAAQQEAARSESARIKAEAARVEAAHIESEKLAFDKAADKEVSTYSPEKNVVSDSKKLVEKDCSEEDD